MQLQNRITKQVIILLTVNFVIPQEHGQTRRLITTQQRPSHWWVLIQLLLVPPVIPMDLPVERQQPVWLVIRPSSMLRQIQIIHQPSSLLIVQLVILQLPGHLQRLTTTQQPHSRLLTVISG